jgi:dTDP-4-dehydrorhamnose reductase
MKRILLLGATGQVGQALIAETLPADWELGAFGRAKCDITDHRATQRALRDFGPDLVINAVAMTNVDRCEREQDLAVAVNFEAPANLAAQCSAMDVPLIHLSTDYVFDGKNGGRPYKPDDEMDPVNIYGNTKMMGEESVRHEMAWHVILRVSSIFSAFGSNLLTRTLAMIEQKDELKIVTDQTSCPTYAPDLAKVLIVLTDAILRGKHNAFGTFHFCGEPAVTRFEFTQAIMEAYAPHSAKNPRLLPALSSDFPGSAERPSYSVLDCAKIRDLYGIAQRPWREGLTEAIASLQQQGRLRA